jgi:serine/threonine protein kinase
MVSEVITSQKYTAKADLWSIGVIIYQALTARAPFPQPNPPALRDFYNSHTNIKAPLPEGISTCLRDLINSLLEKDVDRRITFDKFFKHPFIKNYEEQKARRDADQAKLDQLLQQKPPRHDSSRVQQPVNSPVVTNRPSNCGR